ncbi:Zinc finger domain-containing protein, LSD1 subclass [Bosea sp. 62]|uniref:zinc finger domain-containing protein n=1 Tax=unclassified Bosea (in: a-proteobacteria) TaxID=2653178 RepID=UPI0012519E62|nr:MULTISPECIES: zinc-ribbon domain-containing protein [unclassified Bosea (in: a-proteobacteria)]CAD5250701.1 Zinc finger domain-containing protein, LSD1 subclass [Bosea sp. 21B]CAD5263393.1 Zinc finger domain-containing protein, LSD1 subclass [Bosea sp. 7B]CAD5271347.1 Zinc finger domain-containing protein, LSD1 subclass [Bosea sp. 46]VVT43937.1 Zinc finger domain-containing protein, LSD1 subclass [Bosea sp. EC-HK365B]VXB16368.1 Zinc finger domain-containing protein, LSD1 subclass [Bosea sp.
MQIVCPNCASRYEIAEAKIGTGGRKVRCASCQTTWQIEAPRASDAQPAEEVLQSDLDAAIPELPSPPSAEQTAAELEEELRRAAEIDANISAIASEQTEPPQPDAARSPPPGRKRSWIAPRNPAARLSPAAAGIFVATGLAALGLGLWQRERIVRMVPQFAGLYASIGLPVNVRGLAFSAVESELVQDQQGRFLVVSGDVTNVAKGATRVPPITVMVQSEDGKVLYSWTTEPPRPSLEPAELMHFRARLASPPNDGRSVQLRFGAGSPGGIASLY